MTRKWQDGDLQLGPDPARHHQILARRHTTAIEMIPPWNPAVSTISR